MLLLAFRAVEGRAARLDCASDAAAAPLFQAWLALSTIDLEGMAEVTEIPLDIYEITDARPAGIYRLCDDIVGGGGEPLDSSGNT